MVTKSLFIAGAIAFCIPHATVASQHTPPVHYHYYTPAKSSMGGIGKLVLWGAVAATAYYAYSWYDKKNMERLLSAITKKFEAVTTVIETKTQELKDWVTQEVRSDGAKTREEIRDLKKSVDALAKATNAQRHTTK